MNTSLWGLVPPMTDPLGKQWNQPGLNEIERTPDGYVIMRKAVFEKLKEYSTTLPTGAYPGKMWRRQTNTGWLLCWFGEHEDPDKCTINHRPIILKEMAVLLGM